VDQVGVVHDAPPTFARWLRGAGSLQDHSAPQLRHRDQRSMPRSPRGTSSPPQSRQLGLDEGDGDAGVEGRHGVDTSGIGSMHRARRLPHEISFAEVNRLARIDRGARLDQATLLLVSRLATGSRRSS
jgi:hypothetical protein